MLTEKRKKFRDYFLKSGNAYEAAIKAGYSESYAKAQSYKLLEIVGIKENIEKKDKERIANADEVLQYFTKVMRGESVSNIVVIEGTGEGCSEAKEFEKKPDEKERLDAAKQLAKRYGIDKMETKNLTEGGVKFEFKR